MHRNKILKHCFILLILSAVIYLGGNNLVSLTNPDEVFYTLTAKEMAQHQTWIVPMMFDQPQFEKPILTYWLLRISHILFGQTNFAPRFFPAVFALLGVLAVYLLGILGLRDRRAAFISGLILMTSGLYLGLAKTVFTDMIFSVLILLTFLCFYWGYVNPRRQGTGIILSFIFSALAVLTKGPLGFIIPGAAIVLFLGIRRQIKFLWTPATLWGIAVFLFIALPWYVFCIRQFGDLFVQEFFYNDHLRRLLEAEHRENDTWYFYPGALLLCMFPWTLFVLAAIIIYARNLRPNKQQPFELFLFCWGAVVFAIFQVAHSKLTSYIVPMFPAAALLTGGMINQKLRSRHPFLISRLSWLTWVVFAIFPAALIIAAYRYKDYVSSMTAVFVFVFIFIIFLAALAYTIAKKKYLFSFYGITLVIPIVLFFALANHRGYDAYVSSKMAVAALLRDHKIENTILCSKFFARGVHHYADKPVAVMDINGRGYFSPHPIPFLNSDEKLSEFLTQQVTTYAILRKSAFEHLGNLAQERKWQIDLLHTIGDEYVVCIHTVPGQIPVSLKKFHNQDRVLILAPHPDDETIGAGGIIQRVIKEGGKVKVVLFTNGDNNELSFIVYEKRLTLRKGEFLHMGEVRRKESLAALASLGVAANDVIALGYPDFGTMEILTKYWGGREPFRSMFTRETKVVYPQTLSPHAPYVGESILQDLEKIIRDFQPTKIFVSHPADTNRDHRALYLFTQVALWDLENKINPPEIFPYLIHAPGWPQPRGFHPDVDITPPVVLTNNQIRWKRFNLTDNEVNSKRNAIAFYKSQIECAPSYLYTYARQAELFSDYPPILLKPQDGEAVSWQTMITDHTERKSRKPASRISRMDCALQNKDLLFKLKLRQKMDKAFGLKITFLGYRKETDFAKMPKINLFYGLTGIKIQEKKTWLTGKEVQLTKDGQNLTFQIPLQLLGKPKYILCSARTQFGRIPLDETAWRILQID